MWLSLGYELCDKTGAGIVALQALPVNSSSGSFCLEKKKMKKPGCPGFF